MTDDDKPMTLGQRLRAVREREAMTLDAFAEHFGYGRRSLTAWESDANEPPLDVLRKLREKFDVDPDWMLFGEEGPPRSSYGPADWAMYDALIADVEEACAGFEPPFGDRRKLALARSIYNGARPTNESSRRIVQKVIRLLGPERIAYPDR